WEQSDAVEAWFGNIFEKDSQLIEFIALMHQWEKVPEVRAEFMKNQRGQLLASHSVESWLAVLSRSLAFPVKIRSLELSDKFKGEVMLFSSIMNLRAQFGRNARAGQRSLS